MVRKLKNSLYTQAALVVAWTVVIGGGERGGPESQSAA